MRTVTAVKRTRRQRGSALLEGALVCGAFFYMSIGLMDFGQFLFIHQTLTERAREGVRYGSVNGPTDATSIQNIVLYGQASGGVVPVTAASTDVGIFGVTRNQVIATASGVGTDDYRLTVQIQNYTYNIYSPFIVKSFTGPNILAGLPLGVNY